jgi:hypothetical protein
MNTFIETFLQLGLPLSIVTWLMLQRARPAVIAASVILGSFWFVFGGSLLPNSVFSIENIEIVMNQTAAPTEITKIETPATPSSPIIQVPNQVPNKTKKDLLSTGDLLDY